MTDVRRLPGAIVESWDWQLEASCRGWMSAVSTARRERNAAVSSASQQAKAICQRYPAIADAWTTPSRPGTLRNLGWPLRGRTSRAARGAVPEVPRSDHRSPSRTRNLTQHPRVEACSVTAVAARHAAHPPRPGHVPASWDSSRSASAPPACCGRPRPPWAELPSPHVGCHDPAARPPNPDRSGPAERYVACLSYGV